MALAVPSSGTQHSGVIGIKPCVDIFFLSVRTKNVAVEQDL